MVCRQNLVMPRFGEILQSLELKRVQSRIPEYFKVLKPLCYASQIRSNTNRDNSDAKKGQLTVQ